ncbi:MAG: hypothetical protein IPJ18_11705, partial [Betaproteobacteria bacterium]|nr:hypothetical protein [Betaproteobacteria bacterium]
MALQIGFFKPHLNLHEHLAQHGHEQADSVRADAQQAKQRHAHAQEYGVPASAVDAVLHQLGDCLIVKADSPRITQITLRQPNDSQGGEQHCPAKQTHDRVYVERQATQCCKRGGRHGQREHIAGQTENQALERPTHIA